MTEPLTPEEEAVLRADIAAVGLCVVDDDGDVCLTHSEIAFGEGQCEDSPLQLARLLATLDAARAEAPGLHALALVQAGTGGVFLDGTTNHPPIDFDAPEPTLDRAEAAERSEPGLDVERLARAMNRVFGSEDGDTYGPAIVREYAALAAKP